MGNFFKPIDFGANGVGLSRVGGAGLRAFRTSRGLFIGDGGDAFMASDLAAGAVLTGEFGIGMVLTGDLGIGKALTGDLGIGVALTGDLGIGGVLTGDLGIGKVLTGDFGIDISALAAGVKTRFGDNVDGGISTFFIGLRIPSGASIAACATGPSGLTLGGTNSLITRNKISLLTQFHLPLE